MGSHPRRLWAAGLITTLIAPAAALAQERTRPPVLVVEDLLGDDWKAARLAKEELARIGARGVLPLLEARAAAARRSDVRAPIDAALRGIVGVLAEEIGRPLAEPAERVAADGALGGILGASDRERPDLLIVSLDPSEFGELGSISAEAPSTWFGKREVARRARSALVRLGPPTTGFLFDVPPLIPPERARVLEVVLERIYINERDQILVLDPSARAAFRRRYRGLADLALPIVSAGLRDEDASVRAMFQGIRDDVLTTALDGLADADPRVREAAEETLFKLGDLAQPSLLNIAAGEDAARATPHHIEAATRLARRIRYGLSLDLVRRLGHDMQGYAQQSYRERRACVFELERLGREEAIPTLRALLREEGSLAVQTVAAIGLFRLGDPTGAQWLALHSSGVPLPQISKRELAAIYMDQGLRYLTLGRFERAEREFKSVLQVEPKNDIAWYNLACTYSRWGKIEEALEHLKKAIAYGFDDASHMAKDPDLDPLRTDPRFQKMMADLERSEPAGGEDEDTDDEGPEGAPPLDDDEPDDEPGLDDEDGAGGRE